jgi:cellulose synthase/poly-beta-1,6-N-acetylglucosamine synthase-like glycosyltransferase
MRLRTSCNPGRASSRLFPSLETVNAPLEIAAVRGVYESSASIRLVVVAKDPGPAGDALNAAVNAASLPLLACFDPESEFQQDALLRLVWPMLEAPGETPALACAVECGTGDSLLGSFAEIEFLRSWLGRSIAFAGWNALIPEPGCAVLVERQAVLDGGGCHGGLAPLFASIHGSARAAGRKYRIPFIPDPVTSLEVRDDVSSLLRQVGRRQASIAQAIRRAPSLVRGWGSLGRWGLSALLFTRLLRPLAETALYLLAIVALLSGWINWRLALALLLATVASGTIISASAVVLREVAEYTPAPPGRLIRLLFASLAEGFGYRQLRDLKMITAFFGSDAR